MQSNPARSRVLLCGMGLPRFIMLQRTVSRSASASAAASVPAPIRGFRLEAVTAKVKPTDYVLALQQGPNIFHFMAFPGLEKKALCGHLLNAFPNDHRCFHTVFGRPGIPLDFVADIDLPVGPSNATSCDADLTNILTSFHKVMNEHVRNPCDHVMLLHSGSTSSKHSFHLHASVKNSAFDNLTAMKDLALLVNQDLQQNIFDTAIYRPAGSIRIAYAGKFEAPSRILVPYQSTHEPLLKLVSDVSSATKEDIMAMSLVVRPEVTESVQLASGSSAAPVKLIKKASTTKMSGETDASGRPIPMHMSEKFKYARLGQALSALNKLPPSVAENYDTWIRVGLSLHSFGHENTIKQHWINFSARCPTKFDPKACDKNWEKFAERPDPYNWRRGYNYMTRVLRATARNS